MIRPVGRSASQRRPAAEASRETDGNTKQLALAGTEYNTHNRETFRPGCTERQLQVRLLLSLNIAQTLKQTRGDAASYAL